PFPSTTLFRSWQDGMAADPSAMALTGELREERRRQKEAEAQAVFEDARKRAQAAGVALETVYVPERLPDEAILETADRCGADLVVMASHGHRGLRKLLLGSQTQAVVSRGHLPVLVVRRAARGAARPRSRWPRFRARPRAPASPAALRPGGPAARRGRGSPRASPRSRRGSRRAGRETRAPPTCRRRRPGPPCPAGDRGPSPPRPARCRRAAPLPAGPARA